MPTILNKWGIKAVVSEERAAEMVEYDGATIIKDDDPTPQTKKEPVNQVSINELPNDQKFEAQGLSEKEREEKFGKTEIAEVKKEETTEEKKAKEPKVDKKEELRKALDDKGIKYDKRWGEDRLQELVNLNK